MRKSIFFFQLILINISLNLYSQKPPEKFGKISIEDLKNISCPIDSNAHAYFIFDYGNSYFEYADTKVSSVEIHNNKKGFQLYFTRHFRIKILDNQGFSWADVDIPLYKDTDEEKIIYLKAITYNLENNKINITKLEKNEVFSEESNQFWSSAKFAMPAIREGSVIEIKYTIKSDFFFNLRQWYFQRTIPVIQSEYHVTIPEYFNYNQTQKGYFPIKSETDGKLSHLTITYHQKAQGTGVKEETYTNSFDYNENIYHYYAKEIPAFPIEGYLKTEENYLSKIEFELANTKFPNTSMQYFTTSWEKIDENLMDKPNFGKLLDKKNHIKSDAERIKKLGLKDFLLLNHAFVFMKNQMVWNGLQSIYPTSNLDKEYKNRSGSCADINLNMVVLLRELGFEAYPLLLSTQKHGIIHPVHPSMSSFNYVISMAVIGTDTLLMDATDPSSEINLLPVRCLNDRGRIVNNAGGSWVSLKDLKTYSMKESYKMNVGENFGFTCANQLVLNDYAAYYYINELKKFNNIDDYKESLEKEHKGFKITDINVGEMDSAKISLNISLNILQENYSEKSSDIAFFNPAYRPFISENPFKLEKREYPVEFDYPYSVQQAYSISFPECYTITEIPKSIVSRSPDGNLRYIYNISQLGNTVILNIIFTLNRTLFLPEEYETLKKFFQLMMDKQGELIVLKKER